MEPTDIVGQLVSFFSIFFCGDWNIGGVLMGGVGKKDSEDVGWGSDFKSHTFHYYLGIIKQ